MGLLGDALNQAWQETKASLWEATIDNPIGGLGPILKIATHTEYIINDWEEVRVPRGWGGISRAKEIGMIKANRKDIKIMGFSDDGFYVPKGQKAEAVAYLNSINLKAE
jgi:hypothetical protein